MRLIIKVLVLAITLFPEFMNAQSVEALDKANGFKTVHLNSPIILNIKSLSFANKESNGIVSYRLKTPSDIVFHQVAPKSAFFDYYQGKLYSILMIFDDSAGLSYRRIMDELELMYGTPTEYRETLTGNFWVAWKGNRVMLLTQYFKNKKSYAIEFRSVDLERKVLLNNN